MLLREKAPLRVIVIRVNAILWPSVYATHACSSVDVYLCYSTRTAYVTLIKDFYPPYDWNVFVKEFFVLFCNPAGESVHVTTPIDIVELMVGFLIRVECGSINLRDIQSCAVG